MILLKLRRHIEDPWGLMKPNSWRQRMKLTMQIWTGMSSLQSLLRKLYSVRYTESMTRLVLVPVGHCLRVKCNLKGF